MLINYNEWFSQCLKPIKGIIHIGAHDCEEQSVYDQIGMTKEKVIWIEAMKHKVDQYQNQYQIYNLVVSDQDNESVIFKVANNGQSSSFLDLETHKQHHPNIYYTHGIQMLTTRMDTFIKQQSINIQNYNFLNLDIQGAELLAIKGFGNLLDQVDYIYSEVNTEHLYRNCALLPDLDEYLLSFGFRRVITKMTEHQWGDAFYVKN